MALFRPMRLWRRRKRMRWKLSFLREAADAIEVAIAFAHRNPAPLVGADRISWSESGQGRQMALVPVDAHVHAGLGKQSDRRQRVDPWNGIELFDHRCVGLGAREELELDFGHLSIDGVA